MVKLVSLVASLTGFFLLGSAAPPVMQPSPAAAVMARSVADAGQPHAAAIAPEPPQPPPPPPPPPPTPQEALQEGVLIVVSIPSQKMFVFRRGELWDTSAVSTGKRGHETPTGVFPILQKKVEHRSNLYDDAPMPYMQRLTWDGVALHAGRVPGYPASHGCIRLPKAFAKRLYEITGFRKTIVVIVDEPLTSAEDARKLA